MKALILGTAGLQVNIPIGSFPLDYQSIIFMDDKVSTDVAGAAYSHCLVLGKLGDDTTFLTGIGNDEHAYVIEKAIKDSKATCIIERLDKESMVSVILYDENGRRMILREGRMNHLYRMNPKVYEDLESDYDVAMFSMSGFSRDLLTVLKEKGIPIACDIQTISNLTNEYGKDFMDYSDIIFFSNDNFEGNERDLIRDLYKKYQYKIICVGMGAEGCMLCVDGEVKHYPAIPTEVVNTVGAGDSLFASFVHCYYNGDDPAVAIKKAQIFAAEKIRHKTASKGFIDNEKLEQIYQDFLLG